MMLPIQIFGNDNANVFDKISGTESFSTKLNRNVTGYLLAFACKAWHIRISIFTFCTIFPKYRGIIVHWGIKSPLNHPPLHFFSQPTLKSASRPSCSKFLLKATKFLLNILSLTFQLWQRKTYSFANLFCR